MESLRDQEVVLISATEKKQGMVSKPCRRVQWFVLSYGDPVVRCPLLLPLLLRCGFVGFAPPPPPRRGSVGIVQ